MGIVITGGSGLIGSSLIQRLSREIEIISVDTRPPRNKITGVKYFQRDFKEFQIPDNTEGIIHLAAVSRVVTAEQKMVETLQNNVMNLLELLDQINDREKLPWIIYGSSREVYGESSRRPVAENFDLNPINLYGESKVAAEKLIKLYTKIGGNGICLRFSNVYGGDTDHLDRVIPKFILNALQNLPLEVQGRNNTFDFTHVEDTVNGILLSIEHLRSGERRGYFNDFNICTGRETSLEKLAKLIKALTSSNSPIIYGAIRDFDVKNFVGSWEKSNRILNYSPSIFLEEGITQYIRLLQQQNLKVVQ